MYQKQNTLISRRGYSGIGGLGSIVDSVADTLKGALTFYGESKRAEGAAGAVQTASAPVVVPAPSSGIPTTALVIGGVAVVGLAFVLLRKKKG
jgi:LPXTG-motif cell wall-anchored protein